MSRIALFPNALGTGVFTLESPNSNSDQTLTLPDETGVVISNVTTSYTTLLSDVSTLQSDVTTLQGDIGTFKTYVTFNSSGGTVTILSSRNVSGVARISAGSYTVTFDVALPSADYGVLLGGSAGVMWAPSSGAPATGSIGISFKNDAGSYVDGYCYTCALVY